MRIILCCLVLLFFPVHLNAQQLDRADKVKAAYLFNFTKFISWPSASQEPLMFCMQSEQLFQDFFAEMVSERRVGKEMRLITPVSLDTAVYCDIAYVTDNHYIHSKALARAALIKDIDGKVNAKAVFTLFKKDHKLRFDINTDEVERLNLTISSELLKLAKTR